MWGVEPQESVSAPIRTGAHARQPRGSATASQTHQPGSAPAPTARDVRARRPECDPASQPGAAPCPPIRSPPMHSATLILIAPLAACLVGGADTTGTTRVPLPRQPHVR